MNIRSKLALAIAAVFLGVALFVQQSRIAELQNALGKSSIRLQNHSLSTHPTNSNESELEEMIALLKTETADLHRLRNEVAILRSQKPPLERLRQENAVLTAKAAEPARSKPSVMPRDLAVATLRDAGLATPRAAVETFFWAMCNGEMEKLFQACPKLEKEIRGNPEAEKAFHGFLPNVRAGFMGYNFVGTEQSSPTRAEVKLFSVSGNILKVPLELEGLEWKVKGFPE